MNIIVDHFASYLSSFNKQRNKYNNMSMKKAVFPLTLLTSYNIYYVNHIHIPKLGYLT